MATFVGTAWVAERLDDPNYVILDPRRPMKYLSGHLRNAVNVPAYKCFDAELALLPVETLAQQLGAGGLDGRRSPILYDSYDGQNSSVLAWILEYLGRDDVSIMDHFYDQWLAEKREVLYKPVAGTTRSFTPHVKPGIRIAADEIQSTPSLKLVDFRSSEEFTGERDMDNKPGHIPGAKHIFWRDLVTTEGFLAPAERLQQLFAGAGVQPADRIVSYCRSGLRAAVGYVALKQLGYNVQLYDGSYRDWVKRGLPVEAMV
jgi:thiosulfate/3-mercaptopyruvate sulfurtransferase